MKNSKNKLEETLAVFSPSELRFFSDYLNNPLFNHREDVRKLQQWLLENELTERAAAFAAVYPGVAFDAQKMRLLQSRLQKLAEQFLALRQWLETPAARDFQLLRALRRRGLETQFPDALQSLKNSLESQPLRNSDYFLALGEVLWEEARFETLRQPSATVFLERLSENADLLWLTQKLRYMCLVRAQQLVYKTVHELRFREEIETMVRRYELLEVPAIGIWYYCLHMLEDSENEAYFTRFKALLLAHDSAFNADEIRDLYLFAVNYCIRKVNLGQRTFQFDIMDFYKNGLLKGFLLENGQLSRFTFHNIVGAGIQTKEYEWVANFINQYKNNLPRSHRESTFKFSLARLGYAQKQYEEILPLLQNSNYYDPLIALAAKALALKVYYETGEYNLLESHLEAMKIYIRRKSSVGYHGTYYLNLVKFTQKLIQLDPRKRPAREALKLKIMEEPALADREWLLTQLQS